MQGRLVAGRYRLVDTIGSGGMGRVWRAHDEVLHRSVAVKELAAALYVSDSDRERLLHRTRAEARAAARISHSAVVTVHDVLEHDGRPWIVMELVEGRSLADEVRDKGRIEPVEAARIGMWVLRALRAAHAAGVLHRDVKPGNVLLAHDGRVLLTDFGIAQIEGDSTITRTGEVVGSVDYLAPERVRGHDPGPAADLWSLGATLYTAVEGRSPFRRTSPLGTMQAVVEEEPEEPRSAGVLKPVLDALLLKHPDDRPSAADAERMLAEAAQGRIPGTGAHSGDGPTGPTAALGHPGAATGTGAASGTASGVGGEGTGGAGTATGAPAAAGTRPGQPAGAAGTGTHGGVPGQGPGATRPATPTAVLGTPGAPGSPGAPASPGAPGSFGAPGASGSWAPGTPAPGGTAYASPPAAGGAGGSGAAGRGKPAGSWPKWRTLALVVALAAVIGGVTAVGLETLDSRGSADAAGPDRTARPTATGAGDGDGPSPRVSTSLTAGEDGDGADAIGGDEQSAGVPDGWRLYEDPLGFSLYLPEGWQRSVSIPETDGLQQVDYTPDRGEHLIRIAVDTSPDFDDAHAHLTDIDAQLRKQLTDYRQVTLTRRTYRDRPAARLDYTWTQQLDASRPRGSYRAADLMYLSRDGVEYALCMSSPVGEWDATARQFDTVLRGWREAPAQD